MTENNEKLSFSACLLKQTKVWYKDTLSGFKYVAAFALCLLMIYFGYRIGAEFLIKNVSPIIASGLPWYVYFIVLLALIPFIAAFGDCISRHTNIDADNFFMISIIIAMVVYFIALIVPTGMMNLSVTSDNAGPLLMSILVVPFIMSIYGSTMAFGSFLLLCDKRN